MQGLYRLVSDHGFAEIFTLIALGLIFLSYLSFIWGNSKRLNTELSSFSWLQIYLCGFIVFITATILLGKIIVPKNADNLLQLLRLYEPLRYLTLKFQLLLQTIIRMLM